MCNGLRTICNSAYSLPIRCLFTAYSLPIHAHPLKGTEPWNNSAFWRVMGRVLAASAGPLVVLYSSSISLFILYSSSILLYSSSIHPRFSLDSASIQPVSDPFSDDYFLKVQSLFRVWGISASLIPIEQYWGPCHSYSKAQNGWDLPTRKLCLSCPKAKMV